MRSTAAEYLTAATVVHRGDSFNNGSDPSLKSGASIQHVTSFSACAASAVHLGRGADRGRPRSVDCCWRHKRASSRADFRFVRRAYSAAHSPAGCNCAFTGCRVSCSSATRHSSARRNYQRLWEISNCIVTVTARALARFFAVSVAWIPRHFSKDIKVCPNKHDRGVHGPLPRQTSLELVVWFDCAAGGRGPVERLNHKGVQSTVSPAGSFGPSLEAFLAVLPIGASSGGHRFPNYVGTGQDCHRPGNGAWLT